MRGYIAIILHAHLPFVRHPEHEKCMEEHWLFEAMTECYLPLVQVIRGWVRDRVPARLTISISPTLCAMLRDPLLQARFERYLAQLIELAEHEARRTLLQHEYRRLAMFYRERFEMLRATYLECGRNLVCEFRRLRDEGLIEIITTAATHAILPLLVNHPPSVRAQVMVARDCHRECFGGEPFGFWLPECAYAPEIEPVLQEANIRWVVVDSHGLLNAQPKPLLGVYAPVFTHNGIAVFGRDPVSARQVWSRHVGYPGDPRYRDFYRDIGFDLDIEYLKPYLPSPTTRSSTGIKYHSITGPTPDKRYYDPDTAQEAIETHVEHFLQARLHQMQQAARATSQPPIIVMPFDAELFGHWWFEGLAFLDRFVRRAALHASGMVLTTPTDYLRKHYTHQVASPAPSSWGAAGYFSRWLDEHTAWIYPPLRAAARRMTNLTQQIRNPTAQQICILNRAAQELLLAQASDWPFMIHTHSAQAYAIRRLTTHMIQFSELLALLNTGPMHNLPPLIHPHNPPTPLHVNYTYFAPHVFTTL